MLSSCHKRHTILSKCLPSLSCAAIKTVIIDNIIDFFKGLKFSCVHSAECSVIHLGYYHFRKCGLVLRMKCDVKKWFCI